VTFRTSQLWVTLTALVLSPLFFGSIDQLWVPLWTVLLSISALLGLATPLNAVQTRVMIAFLCIAGEYALVAALQVVPNVLPGVTDPIWVQSSRLLGIDTAPRISGTAEISTIAVGHFLLLVTAFLSGFWSGTSRRNASTLIFSARTAVLLYAVYGLVSLTIAPDMLLWTPKFAYRGSLTATFVNHNSAATYLGCGVILWSCRAYASVQSLQMSSLRLLLLSPANQQIGLTIIFRASAALTCVFALLLTNSRGGLICSSFGLLVAIGLLLANRFKRRVVFVAAFIGLAFIIVIAWLSKTGRIGSEGVIDNGRWLVYNLSVSAIRERPWFGAGAGTFESLFSSLRTPELNSWGVWDYAHSTILEIAVEMGLPVAITIFIASCTSILLLLRRTLRSNDRIRIALAALTGIAVLTFLHSAIDFSLQIPGYLIPFEILLGCGLAMATSDDVEVRRPRRTGTIAPSTQAELQMQLERNANQFRIAVRL
jgi:O-antigen ligase